MGIFDRASGPWKTAIINRDCLNPAGNAGISNAADAIQISTDQMIGKGGPVRLFRFTTVKVTVSVTATA